MGVRSRSTVGVSGLDRGGGGFGVGLAGIRAGGRWCGGGGGRFDRMGMILNVPAGRLRVLKSWGGLGSVLGGGGYLFVLGLCRWGWMFGG
jgi:hypothetical protein